MPGFHWHNFTHRPGFVPRPVRYHASEHILGIAITHATTTLSRQSNCDGQQIMKFMGTLWFVTGTCAVQQDAWAGRHAVGVVFYKRPTVLYIGRQRHAWLTALRLSNTQFYSRRTVVVDQYTQYCTRPLNSSPPSTLHYAKHALSN